MHAMSRAETTQLKHSSRGKSNAIALAMVARK